MDHEKLLAFDTAILDQADADLNAIKKVEDAYIRSNPSLYIRDQTGQYLIRVKIRRPLPHAGIIGKIGNCLSNLRDPLDHLITILAESRSLTLNHPERTGFPVFLSREEYFALKIKERMITRGEWSLQEVSPEVRGVVELLQPYHQANAADSHPLWRLHMLTNIKKHRRPLAAGVVALSSAIGISRARDCVLSGDLGLIFGAFEDGAIIARFTLTQFAPDAILELHLEIATHVAFSRAEPAHGAPLVTTLEEIRNHVRNVVVPILELYI